MEKRIHDVSNSPVVQGRTPIKRLGLSRKRKVSDSPCSLNIKIQSCGDLSPESSIPNDDKVSRFFK